MKIVGKSPADIAKPIRPYYSNVTRDSGSGLVFVSGQLALDGQGKCVGVGDPTLQARKCLENLRDLLEANDSSIGQLLKVTVYVTDVRHLDAMTNVRIEFFGDSGPASTLVQVAALAYPECLVEIEGIASSRP